MRSLQQFGDKFCIKHASIITQNGGRWSKIAPTTGKLTYDIANAQVILLVAGRLIRQDANRLKEIGRSGAFLNAVSNRLAASSDRARFLGMIVGTGLSELMEEPGNAMKFDLEEMQSEEAQWYLSLTKVQDQVGSFDSMKALQETQLHLRQPSTESRLSQKSSGKPTRSQSSKIVAIEEIDESGEETEEDEDLIPYEKPDDDAEDEEEDPTLVQRNKPTAPV